VKKPLLGVVSEPSLLRLESGFGCPPEQQRSGEGSSKPARSSAEYSPRYSLGQTAPLFLQQQPTP